MIHIDESFAHDMRAPNPQPVPSKESGATSAFISDAAVVDDDDCRDANEIRHCRCSVGLGNDGDVGPMKSN